MTFQVGDKVKYIHDGSKGVISAVNANDTYLVTWNDGFGNNVSWPENYLVLRKKKQKVKPENVTVANNDTLDRLVNEVEGLLDTVYGPEETYEDWVGPDDISVKVEVTERVAGLKREVFSVQSRAIKRLQEKVKKLESGEYARQPSNHELELRLQTVEHKVL